MRCKSCGHEWHQTLEGAQDIERKDDSSAADSGVDDALADKKAAETQDQESSEAAESKAADDSGVDPDSGVEADENLDNFFESEEDASETEDVEEDSETETETEPEPGAEKVDEDAEKHADSDSEKNPKFVYAASIGPAAAAGVVFLILAIIVSGPFMKFFPGSASFYSFFGIKADLAGEQIIFENVSALTRTNDENRRVLEVNGRLLNLGSDTTEVPAVEIDVETPEGIVKWIYEYEDAPVTLEPQMMHSFTATFVDPPEGIEEAVLKLVPLGAERTLVTKEDSEYAGQNSAENASQESSKEDAASSED